ncbi:MAG: YggT family protein [Spirochaetaceae bacterium]|nr:YggT family protein [Spirochaetaceae bacterium]
MFSALFSFLASLISLYSFLCFIAICLTWFPNLLYSKVGKVITSLTEPFLGMFRRFRFFRTTNLDFTPILGIGVLAILSNICTTFANAQKFSLGVLLSIPIQMAWSVITSILGIFIILLLVRTIFYLINSNSPSSLWNALDQFISPILYAITSRIYKNNFVTYKKALLTGLAVFVAIFLIGNILISIILGILQNLPF